MSLKWQKRVKRSKSARNLLPLRPLYHAVPLDRELWLRRSNCLLSVNGSILSEHVTNHKVTETTLLHAHFKKCEEDFICEILNIFFMHHFLPYYTTSTYNIHHHPFHIHRMIELYKVTFSTRSTCRDQFLHFLSPVIKYQIR